MTFKQAQELRAHVRKVEQGWQVVYVSKITRTQTDAETGEANAREIPFMRSYTVFNAEQIEGSPLHYYAVPRRASTRSTATPRPKHSLPQPAQKCATAVIAPITAAPIESFRDPESYYVTRGHETVHWTQHPLRLAREFDCKRRGDEGYAERRPYSAACRTWASRPARMRRPGSAPVCSPRSKIGAPATMVAS